MKLTTTQLKTLTCTGRYDCRCEPCLDEIERRAEEYAAEQAYEAGLRAA